MFGRSVTAISAGTVMTITLLFVMQSLIDMQPPAFGAKTQHVPINFVRVQKNEVVRPQRREVIEREKLSKAPVPPLTPLHSDNTTTIRIPNHGPGIVPLIIDVKSSPFSDGPLVALVRVAPTYPARARARNISGHVIVKFDVTANGMVANVEVLESSDTVLEQAAIKAAQRFKYYPRVVDGTPLTTTGVQNLFTFEMENQ